MTANDEPTVAALRRLAAAHAPDDAWQPDAPRVLHRGRVLRARRRTSTAAAGALVLALAIGVPAALAGHRATGPVTPGQPTSTTSPSVAPSTAPSATTSLGPVSANAYGQATYAVGDAQAAVLDVPNLYAVNVPQTLASQAVAHGVGGVDVTVAASGSHGVTVALDASANHGTTATVDLAWPADERASDYSMAHHYPIPQVVTSSTDSFQYAYLVGTVPPWLHDPVVLLVSDTAWTLPGGGTTHVAQVPTFRAPTPDGRLMFVITGAGGMALDWLAPGHHVAIAFANSNEPQPFVPGCEQDIGAYGCNLVPMPSQYLTGVPAQFSAVSDQPSPTVTTTRWPAVAPAPVEVAPGILAATGAGAAGADGGLTFTGWAGATVSVVRDGTDSDSLIEIIARKGGASTQATEKGFLDAGRSTVVSATFGAPGDGILVGGTAPPDMAGVRVFLAPRVGAFAQAGGGTTTVVEVPTFTVPPRANNPVPADRAWFLAYFTGDAASRVAGTGPWFAGDIVFAGPDGAMEDWACLRAANPACTGPTRTDVASQAVYATIRQLVAKQAAPGR